MATSSETTAETAGSPAQADNSTIVAGAATAVDIADTVVGSGNRSVLEEGDDQDDDTATLLLVLVVLNLAMAAVVIWLVRLSRRA